MDNKIINLVAVCAQQAGGSMFRLYTRAAKDRMVLDGDISPCYAVVELTSFAGMRSICRPEVQEFLSMPIVKDQHTFGVHVNDWIRLRDLFEGYESMTGNGYKALLIEKIKPACTTE